MSASRVPPEEADIMTKNDVQFALEVRETLQDLTGDDDWALVSPEELYKWGVYSGEEDPYTVSMRLLNDSVEPCHCGVE
jgi:hypothetical protein